MCEVNANLVKKDNSIRNLFTAFCITKYRATLVGPECVLFPVIISPHLVLDQKSIYEPVYEKRGLMT
jgi:hypothetical protein